MAQDTTEEFARRLNQAIESNPHAPPQPYGRVTWLKRELEARLGVKVSLNTAHKWTTGASRPREDRVRDLARLLKVDEIWLAMGLRPTADANTKAQEALKSNGAMLVLAGLIELNGGRVTFSDTTGGSTVRANLNGEDMSIVAVSPQGTGETPTVIVPEPTNGARVVVVLCGDTIPGGGHVQLIDITACERQHFGGFSVLEMKRNSKGQFAATEGNCKVGFLSSVRDLVAS